MDRQKRRAGPSLSLSHKFASLGRKPHPRPNQATKSHDHPVCHPILHKVLGLLIRRRGVSLQFIRYLTSFDTQDG